MARLTWQGVTARRLVRHGLTAPVQAARLVDQTGIICGAHAQVMSAAELSIGLRVAEATRRTVQAALWIDRSLVKTYGPRGTVHLLPARDLALWTGALSVAVPPPSGMPRQAGMSGQQTDEVLAAIADSLADAELTIDELNDAVIQRAGQWAGDLVMPAFNGLWPRWRQTISTAANRGVLCFGPNRGRNVTYTSPARWLPGFRPMVGEAALQEVVRRYLYAYGPATPRQFSQWLGVSRSLTADVFDALGDELEAVTIDGAVAWIVAGDSEFPEETLTGLRLLPYCDAYAIGCHPREWLYPGHAGDRALARGQAGTVPVLLIDGVVAGVWHQRRIGRTLAITVEPFRRLTRTQLRELDAQVERVGTILEGEPEITIGEVTAGKHL